MAANSSIDITLPPTYYSALSSITQSYPISEARSLKRTVKSPRLRSPVIKHERSRSDLAESSESGEDRVGLANMMRPLQLQNHRNGSSRAESESADHSPNTHEFDMKSKEEVDEKGEKDHITKVCSDP